MNSNTVTVINPKRALLSVLLAGIMILSAALTASAQDASMVPDDFDWSIYIVGNDGWDEWGSTPQPGSNGYQEPVEYDWYGHTYTLEFETPTPVPQNGSDGSGSYTANPDQVTAPMSDDGWFYQYEEGVFDDFANWTSGQSIPASAFVEGFVGYEQSYNLDCEARSAVDLAAWFGKTISHSEFLYYLPKSDDPNVGFVGSWTDSRGHIPPASYGVYQEPVAALLRNYGVNAVGVYAYTEDALKSQIAAGKPVMVWVVGNVEIGYSVPYTPASTGHTTYVVPYQHTVVVTGYDEDAVYIQDGALRYTRPWNTFLLSWGALGNRAIYVN